LHTQNKKTMQQKTTDLTPTQSYIVITIILLLIALADNF
jgi:hypothetical protein